MKWYAIHVRLRSEKSVYKEPAKKRIECLLPSIDEVHRWCDRIRLVPAQLFPGYLFVKINLPDRVLQTEGVVRFVDTRRPPCVLLADQIEWVRIVLGCPETLRREASLSTGQRVQVVKGPFM